MVAVAASPSAHVSAAKGDAPLPRLRQGFLLLAVSLAFLQAWADRHSIDVDGVSYSDMGDALMRGDWVNGINGYWSPLYPILLGGARALLRPTLYWDHAVVHLVNLAAFVAALFSFDYLLRQVVRGHEAEADRKGHARVPQWCWMAFGYSLFLWASISLNGLQATTPDLWVASAVYLAVAMLLGIRRGDVTAGRFAVLGLVLGVGFLAKAVMFVLAFVFLGASGFAGGGVRKTVPMVLLAAVVFAAVAAPWIVALSAKKGRLTFGDSGSMAYAWSLDAARAFVRSGREISTANFDPYPVAATLQQTRQLVASPAVREFGGAPGTYPVWYDPSNWYPQSFLRFDLGDQLRLVRNNLRTYASLLFGLQGSLAVGLLVLVVYAAQSTGIVAGMVSQWPLLLTALVGLVIYVVGFAYPRYVAPFFVLLYLGLFASAHLPRSVTSMRLVSAIGAVVLVLSGVSIASLLGADAVRSLRAFATGQAEPNPYASVAETLQQMGLQQGDKVAGLRVTTLPGVTLLTHSKWARLSRTPLMAEIVSDDRETDAAKTEAIDAVVRAGASVIIAQHAGTWSSLVKWQPIGSSGFSAYFVAP